MKTGCGKEFRNTLFIWMIIVYRNVLYLPRHKKSKSYCAAKEGNLCKVYIIMKSTGVYIYINILYIMYCAVTCHCTVLVLSFDYGGSGIYILW